MRGPGSDVDVSGVMAPLEQIDVHPRSAGVVASVGVDIGDYVRKGDVIATMSAPEGGGNGEKILAPFDGVVTRRYLVAGSLVAEGLSSTSPLVNIAQDTVLRASFSVPESALRGLGPGAPLAIEIPEFGGGSMQKFPGFRGSLIPEPAPCRWRRTCRMPTARFCPALRPGFGFAPSQSPGSRAAGLCHQARIDALRLRRQQGA